MTWGAGKLLISGDCATWGCRRKMISPFQKAILFASLIGMVHTCMKHHDLTGLLFKITRA